MEDGFDFDAFLTASSPMLAGYCAAIVGPADAEDAAQEAYLRLWKKLGGIPNEAAAKAYLYRAAYSVCLDMLRRRKRFREPEKPLPRDNSLSERTAAALMKLSPADRAILYGRAVEEESYGELARRFGKNEAWARKRCSLARKKLAVLLGPNGEDTT